MGVTSLEGNKEKLQRDVGASGNFANSPSTVYEPSGSNFMLSKLTNGVSGTDISNPTLSPPVGFHQCQVIPNFSQSPAERSLEYGRLRGSRKEKKRTECINNAFSELRRRIPNVPMDTKLSKIKTLRLATSYIAYLTDIVQNADPTDGRDGRDFRADLKSLRTRERRRQLEQEQIACAQYQKNGDFSPRPMNGDSTTVIETKSKKKNKGRTGWPEAVWAMELENISSKGGFQSPSQMNQTTFPVNHDRNGGMDVYSQPYLNKEDEKRFMESPTCDANTENGLGLPYNFRFETPMMANPPFRALSGSYARQDEIMPYFQCPPLPLPAASSFSKKLAPVPSLGPELVQIKNGLSSTQTIIGSGVSAHDQSVGMHQTSAQSTFTTVTEIPQIESDQITRNNEVVQPMLGNIPLISEIREEKRNGDVPRYILENDAGFSAPSFVELQTVSAASIRISTSTINGYATFTTSGRPDVQYFGATAVAEPSAL